MTYMMKPLAYVAVIALGFLLRRAGFFDDRDRQTLSRIMLTITLPESKFTTAEETPATEHTAFSTCALQAAQLMPLTLNFCSRIKTPYRLAFIICIRLGLMQSSSFLSAVSSSAADICHITEICFFLLLL